MTCRSGWASVLVALCSLVLCPLPSFAYYLVQQRVTDVGVSYCGFSDLQRYKAWCDANISAWVASNTTCQQYNVCIPLEGYEYMGCANATYCGGLRADAGRKGSSPLAACLVLRAAANGSTATCDVEVQGDSLYDAPPPAPPGPPSAGSGNDWALWKTMTIIWSILGFAMLLVLVVLAVRWLLRRRSQAVTSSPVTVLTDVAKEQLQQQQHQQHQLQSGLGPALLLPAGQGLAPLLPGGAADMTVTVTAMAPDGKPILAYGASHPPPSPLEAMLTPNGNHRQLPPNAGDALLQVAASSRGAFNGPPLRAPLVPLPPQQGVAGPVVGATGPAMASAVFQGPGDGTLPPPGHAAQHQAAAAVISNGVGGVVAADAAAAPAGPGSGGGIPAVVIPAALVPPAAATLQNPTASLEATMSLSPR